MPGSFDNSEDRDRYFKEVINQGERKGQTRGATIDVPFNRHKWKARLAAHAPGCGSPMRVPGTNGGYMACGARLGDQRMFCPHCEAQRVVEALLNA